MTSNNTNETDSILFVDAGNSRIKAALRNEGKWEITFSGRPGELNSMLEYIKTSQRIELVVVSSVVDRVTEALQSAIGGRFRQLTVNDIPAGNLDYKTPDTLGIDRYLACRGARILAEKEPVIVVDAGTACTIDFMDGEGIYRGGVITAGLGMIEAALQSYTPALPVTSRKVPENWPGKSTGECLQWGVTGGFLDMLQAAIGRYRHQYGVSQLWLTGGDAGDIKGLLSGPARLEPNLVFEGMYDLAVTTAR